MMKVAPTAGTARNPASHTEAEVLAALQGHTGSRRWSFRYEHLEPDGTWLRDLDNVTAGTVAQNWLADIKRTATFSMAERGGIDFLADRIRPNVRLHLPPFGVEDFVEWPQGVFLLTTPKRNVNASGQVTREVEGYDQLQVYADEALTDRYTVAAASNVVTAVVTLLNSVLVPPSIVSTPHAGTLSTAKEWPPGTTKLKMINELLSMINYESLSFDEDGQALVRPYRPPSERAPEYTYADDQHGLVVPTVDQELDIFNVPNQWVMVVSEPELDTPIRSTYTNSDPASPTSTVRRQRTITDYREEQEAVDQAALDGKVARLAFEASQVYETIPFQTGLMPIHSGNDVYQLVVSGLAINALYAEHSWKLTMKAGVPMEHQARRVVTV
jgi:hypothetical protein